MQCRAALKSVHLIARVAGEGINAGDNDGRRIPAYLKRRHVLVSVVVRFTVTGAERYLGSDRQRKREIRRADSRSDLSKFLYRCPDSARIKYPIKYPRAVDIIFIFNPRGGAFITAASRNIPDLAARKFEQQRRLGRFPQNLQIVSSPRQSSLVTFPSAKISLAFLLFRDSSSFQTCREYQFFIIAHHHRQDAHSRHVMCRLFRERSRRDRTATALGSSARESFLFPVENQRGFLPRCIANALARPREELCNVASDFGGAE